MQMQNRTQVNGGKEPEEWSPLCGCEIRIYFLIPTINDKKEIKNLLATESLKTKIIVLKSKICLHMKCNLMQLP